MDVKAGIQQRAEIAFERQEQRGLVLVRHPVPHFGAAAELPQEFEQDRVFDLAAGRFEIDQPGILRRFDRGPQRGRLAHQLQRDCILKSVVVHPYRA